MSEAVVQNEGNSIHKRIVSQGEHSGSWLLLLIPVIIFVAHALAFGEWIIDDAGISYVYARNLINGYGLSSQPGLPPVEGYSNFAWVILLSPFFATRLFDPVITPKLISFLLVCASFWLVYKIFPTLSDKPTLGSLFVLSMCAVNTGFVVWNISGLENPLYLFLILLLSAVVIQTGVVNPAQSSRYFFAAGIISGLIALTRPDGVLYIFCSMGALVYLYLSRKYTLQMVIRSGFIFLLPFSLIFGGYLLFRISYFGTWLPNTYYAKGWAFANPSISLAQMLVVFTWRFAGLFDSISGKLGVLVMILILPVVWMMIRHKQLTFPRFIILLQLGISILIYLLLPPDWMGHYRFATPFLVFVNIFIYLSIEYLFSGIKNKRQMLVNWPKFIYPAIFFASLVLFIPRTISFAKHPITPFQSIMIDVGDRFNQYASLLSVQNASLLIPDIGGALYVSNLRIYDLAGLTDPTIAQTMSKDQQVFYDYIFEDAKPTFIHTHGPFSYMAAFDGDNRFRRDYLPIREYQDDNLLRIYNQTIFSGDYVRKDAVTDPQVLSRLMILAWQGQ